MHSVSMLTYFVRENMPGLYLLSAPDFTAPRDLGEPLQFDQTFKMFIEYMKGAKVICLDAMGELEESDDLVSDSTTAAGGSNLLQAPTRLVFADNELWREFCSSKLKISQSVLLNIDVRATCWRVLFGVVDGNYRHWPETYANHEKSFKLSLLQVVKAKNIKDLKFDAATIRKDVPRAQLTDSTHELMLKLALGTVVAKDSTVGYAQSMSHIGAVLVRVFYPITSSPNKFSEQCPQISDWFADEKHADVQFRWRLLDVIIGIQKISDQVHQLLVNIDKNGGLKQDAGPMAVYCKQIFSKVALLDPDLHSHIAVTCEAYGTMVSALLFVSWVDSLFAHKMPFEDVVQVWDFLFAGFAHKFSFMKRLEMFCATLCHLQRVRIMNLKEANDIIACMSTLPEQDYKGMSVPIPKVIKETFANLTKHCKEL